MEIYLVSMLIVAGIYGAMALGLNVMWGMAGLVNLGLVGSAAVGAYTTALLTTRGGLPIFLGLMAATAFAAAAGALLSLVAGRLKDNYIKCDAFGFMDVNADYLARLEWRDANTVAIQQLNRRQNVNTLWFANATSGKPREVLVDRDSAWIDIYDDHAGWGPGPSLHWTPDNAKFIWVTERDGWRHAWLVDRAGKMELVRETFDVGPQLDGVSTTNQHIPAKTPNPHTVPALEGSREHDPQRVKLTQKETFPHYPCKRNINLGLC